MVTWFSGLFYLPRLYVYHAMSSDPISLDRFKIMERKLYYGIVLPSAVLTLFFGLLLIHLNGWAVYKSATWLHVKFALIAGLWLYQLYCGRVRKLFLNNANQKSHVFFRILNEVPVLFLVAIVFLAILRPFS